MAGSETKPFIFEKDVRRGLFPSGYDAPDITIGEGHYSVAVGIIPTDIMKLWNVNHSTFAQLNACTTSVHAVVAIAGDGDIKAMEFTEEMKNEAHGLDMPSYAEAKKTVALKHLHDLDDEQPSPMVIQ